MMFDPHVSIELIADRYSKQIADTLSCYDRICYRLEYFAESFQGSNCGYPRSGSDSYRIEAWRAWMPSTPQRQLCQL